MLSQLSNNIIRSFTLFIKIFLNRTNLNVELNIKLNQKMYFHTKTIHANQSFILKDILFNRPSIFTGALKSITYTY